MKKNIKRDNQGRFAKKASQYSFVNLATYTSPEVIEVKNQEWVKYGADNNYFQFLIDRYNGSPTNHACINGISQQIYGKGLNATDASRRPNEYAQMISLLNKEMVKKVCYDLKLMGQAAIQVVYSKDRKKITMCEHFPIETLRAEKADDNGDITGYYYWNDWSTIKPSDKPLRIPAFGTSNQSIEMYYIKPYKAGFYYYSPVSYQGGIQYCELEEEISNYHLNNIMNGLAPGMFISFNNGVPNQQERELIEARIAQKFSGSSNAGKFILAFNDNKEQESTITPVQLSDAHQQYEFLSKESQSKILVSHNVVSPMLLGIRTESGFSSNADEIKTASLLMDNTVIRPFQELLIDAFDQILAFNDISLNLYFITLQPLEFTEVDPSLQNKDDIEEETGYGFNKVDLKPYPWEQCIKEQTARYGAVAAPKICGWIKSNMSEINLKEIDGHPAFESKEKAESMAEAMGCSGSHEHEEDGIVYYMPCESHDEINLKKPCQPGYEQYGMKMKDGKKVPNCIPLKTDLELEEMAVKLSEYGVDEETLLENYNLIDVSEVDYENDDAYDLKIEELNTPKQSTLSKIVNLVRTGKAYPKRKSEQDGVTKQTGLQRFLVRYQYAPLSFDSDGRKFCKAMVRAKKIYRKEDIIKMGKQAVNPGFGVKGAATYSIWLYKGGARCQHKWFRKTYMLTLDGDKSLVSTTKAKSFGFKFPVNDKLVPVAPKNMKYEGYTKAYWDKMGFGK
tara:strand:- start:166 stop:2367 length:2202 start_codon:yes stop_codon:yes gene_type:complete